MRNRNSIASIIPHDVFSASSKMVHYLPHAGSGLTIVDALGNGPDLTISAGTPLATAVGKYTPPASNTTVWAQCTVVNDTAAYLQQLLDFSKPFANILIAVDYEQGNDIGANNGLFSVGKSSTTESGFMSLQISAAEVPTVIYRGANATANQSIPVGADLTGTGRSQLLIDIAYVDANTFTVMGYNNGSISVGGNGDWLAASGTGPVGSGPREHQFGDGFVMGALVSTSLGGAKGSIMNAQAGNNSAIAGLMLARLETPIPGIALATAKYLYNNRGEKPHSLMGR